MRSLERRYKIATDKNPLYSSLVCFAEAVKHQRFSRAIIGKHFDKLVDSEDYQRKDKEEIIEHMLSLSHSPNPVSENTSDDPENMAL